MFVLAMPPPYFAVASLSVSVMLALLTMLPSVVLIAARLNGTSRLQWRIGIVAVYLILGLLIAPTIIVFAQWDGAIECWIEHLMLLTPASFGFWFLLRRRLVGRAETRK